MTVTPRQFRKTEHPTPDGAAPDAAPVSIEFHALEEADRQHLSSRFWSWCELFDRDPDARVAQHPEHLFSQPHEDVFLCEASRGSQIVALGILAAKRLTMRQAGGFGPQVGLHGYRLVGNRLLGQADESLTRRMLAACAMFAREQHATFLLIEDLERSDPLFAAAESLTRDGFRLFSPTGIQERLKIEFPPTPSDYWAKFSSKTRNTFKRKQKKIGVTRLVRITEPGQIAEFLETAHTVSQRTWQSEQLGLRIHNNAEELRFFTFLATQHSLRSYLLFVDEQPAAFLFGTQHKGLFSYEEVGYSREFADRSPGQVLLLQVLEDLLKDNPPRVFDFGGGAADYKQLFATTTSTSGNVWLVPPGLRPQLCLAYLRGCRAIDRFARAMAHKLGVTTRLRQLIRGKHADQSRSHAPRGNIGDDALRRGGNLSLEIITADDDAERQDVRSHAERGNESEHADQSRSHAPRGNAGDDALRRGGSPSLDVIPADDDAERQDARSHAERGNESDGRTP